MPHVIATYTVALFALNRRADRLARIRHEIADRFELLLTSWYFVWGGHTGPAWEYLEREGFEVIGTQMGRNIMARRAPARVNWQAHRLRHIRRGLNLGDTQMTRIAPSVRGAIDTLEALRQEAFETQMRRSTGLGDINERDFASSQLRRGLGQPRNSATAFDYADSVVVWEAIEDERYLLNCHACGDRYCAGPHDCD